MLEQYLIIVGRDLHRGRQLRREHGVYGSLNKAYINSFPDQSALIVVVNCGLHELFMM